MADNPWSNQISNRNFLSPIGFQFTLEKKPKVDFFCNSANLPGINLGVAMQPTYLKDIPIPGDKPTYDDFSIKFMIDEDMVNYLEVHNWITQFGYPRDLGQYQQLLNEDKNSPGTQTAISGMSDGSLIIYSSTYRPNIRVDFRDLFPTSLGQIQFDSTQTDVNYVTAEVVFKYTHYEIVKL